MKILSTPILLIIFLIFGSYSTEVFASAAEKWEYDVKPDQNQKLQITGHKVDQYGKAVNDYTYKPTIDPKTAANRTKMGTVGMNRLLRVTGWGILGNAALQALLEAVDWVIDPAAQSIWRYKKDPNTGFGCKNFGHKWKVGSDVYNCPADAFQTYNICKTNSNATDCSINEMWADIHHTVKVSTLNDLNPPSMIHIEVGFKYAGVTDKNYITVQKGEKIQPDPSTKEELTPDQLADYANHTHPDYGKPELAPKLAPKYNPQIAPDLWKPANPFEYDNSPTVDQVKKDLEKSNPASDDTGIKPKPQDPTPENPNPVPGFDLPEFCSWANVLCDFVDWVKEEPVKDQPQDQNYDDQGIFNKKFDTSFLLSKQCPPDIPLKLQSQYLTGDFTFSMKWLCIIFTALGYPIVFASHCVGIWILYETVTRKEIKW